MEWNLKMPHWDSTESHQESETRLFSLVGSSSDPQQQGGGRIDCSVDLKLGEFGDFGLSNQWKDQTLGASASMVTSSGASKRARAPSSTGHIATCLVDGCVADLSKCREYHKRHKVCELHSKTPIVLVGGLEQRFCQQCSRFHSLSEFDEGKRSCRKRLDGHNRRRRKPQQDTLNPGTLLPNHQGTRYSSYQHISSISMPDSNWINFSAKSEHGALQPHRLPFHFPFLQQSEAAAATTATALGSDRAFSLLSSCSQSSLANPSPIMCSSNNKTSADQHLQQCDNGAELYPCFRSSAGAPMAEMPGVQMEEENAGSNLHCQDMLQSSSSSKVLFEGASEAPPIHWQWYPSSCSDNII